MVALVVANVVCHSDIRRFQSNKSSSILYSLLQLSHCVCVCVGVCVCVCVRKCTQGVLCVHLHL